MKNLRELMVLLVKRGQQLTEADFEKLEREIEKEGNELAKRMISRG
ncbi:hypothetical protein [Thermococcus atlanticus]